MWNQLLVDEDVSRQSGAPQPTRTYSWGSRLLNTSRGEVVWGQDLNNSGGCNPSYNSEVKKKWYQGWFSSCDCGAPPVGCGAVAMGQVMWYWQWPQNYNWSLMPRRLLNSTPLDSATAVAQLLLDCADASNTTYACAGSFSGGIATPIADALKNTFNYPGATVVSRPSNLDNWETLIQTEINNERPVILYGAKALTLDKKHYFVVDGYGYLVSSGPVQMWITNLFHINFGWQGNYNNWFFLDNISGSGTTFNDNQKAIIGIAPQPIISGTSPICSGTPKSFSATNWKSGYYWYKSNNLINISNDAIYNPTISAASSSSNGAVTIGIKNSNNVILATFTVWVGKPSASMTLNTSYPNYEISNLSFEALLNHTNLSSQGITQASWSATNSVATLSNSSTTNAWFKAANIKSPTSPNLQGDIKVRVTNTCGYTDLSTGLTVSLYPPPAPSPAYPNPASDVLNIEAGNSSNVNSQSVSPTFDIRLYDGQGNLLRQTNTKGGTIQFNVSSLPDGLYYLHFSMG